MTDRPPHPPISADDASGVADDDRLGVLVEKSLRGALDADEQQELGALLSRSPRMAELARQIQQEDGTMQTMIHDAATKFDPEVAQRAIEARLEEGKTAWRIVPIMAALLVGGFVLYKWALGDDAGMGWTHVVGLSVMVVILTVISAAISTSRARRLAAEAAEGVDGLESAYAKRLKSIDQWVIWYRVLAVAASGFVFWVLIDALLEEPGSVAKRWLFGAIFVLTLPNLWFAFNRRHLDRVRRRMSGRGDSSSPQD